MRKCILCCCVALLFVSSIMCTQRLRGQIRKKPSDQNCLQYHDGSQWRDKCIHLGCTSRPTYGQPHGTFKRQWCTKQGHGPEGKVGPTGTATIKRLQPEVPSLHSPEKKKQRREKMPERAGAPGSSSPSPSGFPSCRRSPSLLGSLARFFLTLPLVLLSLQVRPRERERQALFVLLPLVLPPALALLPFKGLLLLFP